MSDSFVRSTRLKNSAQHTGEEYQSIFENALEGIFQTSPGGHFIKVNPALARIFGYDSPEDMMQTVTDTSAQLHVDEGVREKFAEILIEYSVSMVGASECPCPL